MFGIGVDIPDTFCDALQRAEDAAYTIVALIVEFAVGDLVVADVFPDVDGFPVQDRAEDVFAFFGFFVDAAFCSGW